MRLPQYLNRSSFFVQKILPPLILFTLIFGAFGFALFAQDRTFLTYPDNVDQAYPWYQKLSTAIHSGELPLWDANSFGGHSFVGDLITGTFYPLNLAWVWLVGSSTGISFRAIELLLLGHFFIAAYGMYLVARSMNLRQISSLASGVIFACSGVLPSRSVGQTVIFLGLAWIPWAFLGFNKWRLGGKKLWLMLSGFSLSMILVSGHIQPFFHACLLMLFLTLFLVRPERSKQYLRAIGTKVLGIAAAVGIALILSLPQLLLSIQYTEHAVRFIGNMPPISASETVNFTTFTNTYAYKLSEFASLFDPIQFPGNEGNSLYVGLVALVLLFGLIFKPLRKILKQHPVWHEYRLFLSVSIATSLVIMVGYLTFIAGLLRLFPFVSQIRQLSRYGIVVHFCMAILLAIAVEVWALYASSLRINKKLRLQLLRLWPVLGLLALNSLYLVWLYFAGNTSLHFAVQNVIVVLVFTALYALVHFKKYLAPSVAMSLFASGIVLSCLINPLWFMPKISTIAANFPVEYYRRTPAIDFLEQSYGKGRVLVRDQALPPNIGSVYKIQNIAGYGATMHKNYYTFINEPDPIDRPGEHMNLLNAQFLVTRNTVPELKLALYDQQRGIYIYERPNALPRAFLLSQKDACQQKLAACTAITNHTYTDDYIEYSYTSTTNDTLVFSEVFYPGWQAYIDDQPVSTQAFGGSGTPTIRSISAPAGSHKVVLKYEPFNL